MALPLQTAHPGPAPSPVAAVRLSIIAAVASNGVIGREGALPWRLPEDLRHFRELTRGHSVVMGRRTWQSLRGPLPERQNLVVTRHAAFVAEGAEVIGSLEEALARAMLPLPVFCIGGAELYARALAVADRLDLTEIRTAFDGDTYFPTFDRGLFHEVERHSHRSEAGVDYDFVTYTRMAHASSG